MPKKKTKQKKEKIEEVFEVTKKGEEKVIEKKGLESVQTEKPGQKESESKFLKYLLITLASVLIFVAAIFFYTNSLKSANYYGINFTTISEGDLIFYRTQIPVHYQGEIVPYNFYFRTNPKDLKKIPFNNSDFELMKFAVINFTNEFNCDGNGIIAIANLRKMHEVFQISFMKDESVGCDPEGRYAYYNLMEGNKTEIEQIGPSCYNVKIADCEILPATEKIMAEMLVKYYEK